VKPRQDHELIPGRAERSRSLSESVNPAVLKYVNRLSDFLFVLARYLHDRGAQDVRWQPGLHR